MKKSVIVAIILLSAYVVPLQARAEVSVSIGISLPPPIIFGAPPAVIVLPDTAGVYVVPDIEGDLYFWGGWWWRPWGGGWYRSYYYDRGWGYYSRVPVFYYDVDPYWRVYYRDQNWYGHRWTYERIPHQQLQRNWKTWDRERHWERQRTWGVQGYTPRPKQQTQELRRQREEQYQKRPEVQQHRQQMQERKRQDEKRGPQVRKPEQQRPTKVRPGEKGRGERQQLQPAENKKLQGGPAQKGERKQGKPGKKEKKEKPDESEEGRKSRDMR
jgi:hypothetical protein